MRKPEIDTSPDSTMIISENLGVTIGQIAHMYLNVGSRVTNAFLIYLVRIYTISNFE